MTAVKRSSNSKWNLIALKFTGHSFLLSAKRRIIQGMEESVTDSHSDTVIDSAEDANWDHNCGPPAIKCSSRVELMCVSAPLRSYGSIDWGIDIMYRLEHHGS